MTVVNVAPTILSVTNDGPIAFGAPANVTVQATDPGLDALTYSFDCDGDGAYEVGPQAGASAACTFGDPGEHTVDVRVDDGDGGSATGSTAVAVLAPTIHEVAGAVDAAVAAGTLQGEGSGNSAGAGWVRGAPC